MNYITGTGRLANEPTKRITKAGAEIADFRLAISTLGKETCFINCSAFSKSAEFTNKHLHKGDLISFNGRLTQREWQGNDGAKHSTYEIAVLDVESLAKKAKSEPAEQSESNRQAVEKGDLDNIDTSEDDMPF